jgi:hypothetical protein
MAGNDFKIVEDSVREQGRGNKWKALAEALEAGKTAFVPSPDDANASSSLTNSLKKRGFRLRRRATTVDGEKGLVFWCEPL